MTRLRITNQGFGTTELLSARTGVSSPLEAVKTKASKVCLPDQLRAGLASGCKNGRIRFQR